MKQLSQDALFSDPVWNQLKTLDARNTWRYHELIRRIRATEVVEEVKEATANWPPEWSPCAGVRKIGGDNAQLTVMEAKISHLTEMMASWMAVGGLPLNGAWLS